MAVLKSLWRKTPYNETAEGSPDLAMVKDGTRMRRTVKVLWEDPVDGSAKDGTAQRDFIGHATVKVAAGGKRYISRETPFPYPHLKNSSDLPYLYCVGAPVMRGVGPQGADDEAVQSFAHALLDLEFRSLPYPILTDAEVLGVGDWAGIPDEGRFGADGTKRRYTTRMVKPGGKIIVLPQGMMKVVDGSASGIPIREGLPFRQASAQVTYVHHDVPEDGVPLRLLEARYNTINSVEFDGWTAETLLFEQADIKPMVSALGDKIADVQLTFKWLPNYSPVSSVAKGHNYILRRVGGVLDYYLVTSTGAAGGTKPYRTADHSDLFRPDQ